MSPDSAATPAPGPAADSQALPAQLSAKHLAILRTESAISDAVIQARGYRTITDAKELTALGFAPAQCRVPGLLLPIHTTDGGNGCHIYRPDAPRSFDDKTKPRLADGAYSQRVIKYETPKGASLRIDCPPACYPQLRDPQTPLWITEGQKKADALASQGLCAIALLGVWAFKGKNELGGTAVLADLDHIAWQGREVRIIFDSDVMTKTAVRQAIERLTAILTHRGARVRAVYLPPGPAGHKVGVDDWLAAGHALAELERLVEAPRPQPKAAPPQVELLDAAPLRLTRPLALVDGRAYAAIWPWVKVTYHETEAHGEIIRHDPPLVVTERRLFIVRDDGQIFGQDGPASCADLGLEVQLPELPPPEALWSTAGVQAYRRGQRPDPLAVLHKIVAVVNQLIDFNRSLADQLLMAEMVACYILTTWFLDAFSVIGFLWPNGDRGCGKTHLLVLIARLAYLGQVITAGGTFASLRDLADYGATLAFDDAENLSDAKQVDPDKRALLLAGNRRGAFVTVKELGADRRWHTRYVNAFCARLFSATRIPDPILASRTIVVPLVRTANRELGNADPEDPAAWPHPRSALLDDLWALALAHLPKMKAYEAAVNRRASLVGRALEPWRAVGGRSLARRPGPRAVAVARRARAPGR